MTTQTATDKPVAAAQPVSLAATGRCWTLLTPDGSEPDDDGYGLPHFRNETDARRFIAGLGEHPISQCVPTLLDQACVTVECSDSDCGYRHDEDDEGVIHFEDQAQADEAVKSYGWTFTADGRPLCPEHSPHRCSLTPSTAAPGKARS